MPVEMVQKSGGKTMQDMSDGQLARITHDSSYGGRIVQCVNRDGNRLVMTVGGTAGQIWRNPVPALSVVLLEPGDTIRVTAN